ncbi:monovalent cation/H+ antiporter complex subunit F [Thiococcus pfennigii]|jgi:multisubunit Na+/H+ antiporter MnhF subunit|uniref:monovalent cation/H+ antiporter complex subunit F n=1 Tax=Thiococcus pfennigii TaxID=1057 RepID=UPI0019068425|nr:monovalent cation/H+ antiporter complex subunit F [Thiococcus pfennigii]MBK1702118.1 cation:proton antiporter [Thiococcus pfennigii]MBK1731328.1 cation:proton antiporter [Thiococcus pfennigii]
MLTLFLLLLVPPILMILWRFFRGPDAANRILALDALTILVIALLALLALFFGRSIYLDVALVFAMVGFAGVILFGRFLEKGV